MITNALLSLLITFLNGVFSFFTTQADVPISNGITSAVVAGSTYYTAMNQFFPFSAIFAIIAFDLLFETIYFTFKLIRFGYRKIPGIS